MKPQETYSQELQLEINVQQDAKFNPNLEKMKILLERINLMAEKISKMKK